MANKVKLLAIVVATATLGFLLWRAQGPLGLHRPAMLQVKGPAQPSLTSIRVVLTPTPVSTAKIRISGPYHIQPVGSKRLLGQGSKLDPTQVTVTSTGFQIASRKYSVTRLELVPEKSPAIWINGHQYRGTVRLFRRPGGKLIAVNVLPLEAYLASVVDSEMPAKFPPEARKAQAIVARTYALYQIAQANRDAPFDLYAGTRSQKYLGYQYRSSKDRLLAGESDSSRRAVAQTRGMACTYNGKIFCTYYSAVCGGRTLHGKELFADAVPAVTSVPCDWCREAKYYRWNAKLTRQELQKALRDHKPAFGSLQSLRAAGRLQPGKMQQFEARDGRTVHQLQATELRSILSGSGVRSPHFQVERNGDDFLIQGRGHGHGIGLCQWGARGQALAGKSAVKIVEHYYPGARIVILTPKK